MKDFSLNHSLTLAATVKFDGDLLVHVLVEIEDVLLLSLAASSLSAPSAAAICASASASSATRTTPTAASEVAAFRHDAVCYRRCICVGRGCLPCTDGNLTSPVGVAAKIGAKSLWQTVRYFPQPLSATTTAPPLTAAGTRRRRASEQARRASNSRSFRPVASHAPFNTGVRRRVVQGGRRTRAGDRLGSK